MTTTNASATTIESAPERAPFVPVMRWAPPDGWDWIDETRRKRTARPTVQEVVSAALKAHGQAAVSRQLGFSRQTCLAVGGGFQTLAAVLIVCGQRIGELARLSDELGEP